MPNSHQSDGRNQLDPFDQCNGVELIAQSIKLRKCLINWEKMNCSCVDLECLGVLVNQHCHVEGGVESCMKLPNKNLNNLPWGEAEVATRLLINASFLVNVFLLDPDWIVMKIWPGKHWLGVGCHG